MISSKLTLAAAVAGAMALGACTAPQGNILAQPGDPNQKTKNAALIGAGAGALLGALSKGDGNRGDGALVGAVIGGESALVSAIRWTSKRRNCVSSLIPTSLSTTLATG